MLNDFQKQLYNDLKNLVETNEAFLTKIQTLDNVEYQVFDYRLATHTDFLNRNARESRGIMFELDENREPIRLACFMPQKFFNYGEGDTLKLDISDDQIDGVMDKLDGSIISTFIHKGELRLKSKTSLHSDHAKEATAWLNKPENITFKYLLQAYTHNGYAVHMELTSPMLRIVVGYEDVKLTVLSMRDNATGELTTRTDLYQNNPQTKEFLKYWVTEYTPEQVRGMTTVIDPTAPVSVKGFIGTVKAATGIEGYIVRLKNGEHLKIKCDWYCALHHTKDSVSAPRRLFECVINGGSDDLKGMFGDDQITIKRILDMEEKVKTVYNRIVKTVEDFYEANKDLSRKDYAIKASGEADDLMSLKMNLYQGKENDYKAFCLKHIELFGVNVHQVYETVEE